MIPYKYSYLIGTIIFLLIWLYLFIKNPSLRSEMLSLGVVFIFLGPLVNYIWYRKDWWHPLYITDTVVGIEDSILGFSNIGIASVIYEHLFNKRYTKKITLNRGKLKDFLPRFLELLAVVIIPMLVMTHILFIHSFWSNLVGLALGGLYLIYRRKDLLKDALYSALLMPIVSLPVFWIPELLSPGCIEYSWQLDKLSGIFLLGAPVEDLIWYALVGFCCGISFKYIFKYKDRKSSYK